VSVEGHFVGSLEGLDFKPDPRAAGGIEGRAVRNAAMRALKPEVMRRLSRIAAADEQEITLARDGRVRFDNAVVARLTPGAPVLKPRLELIGGESAPPLARDVAHERLELWLARTVARDLRPLVALETAWRDGRLASDARGLAFRLIENAGALDAKQEELDHVSAEARAQLRRYGVRIGRHSVFLPSLVRPRAAHTLALLWHAAHPGKFHSVFLARPGALSVPLDRPRSWGECAAAGYRACGRIAVRLDLVEKLADAIDAPAQPDDTALARMIGRPVRELAAILAALGYQRATQEGEAPRWRSAAPRRKRATQAPADNAFSALANLLPANAAPPRRRRRSRA
jgi:ATP-dependent RNA helicase SUPV3L1/SUV3